MAHTNRSNGFSISNGSTIDSRFTAATLSDARAFGDIVRYKGLRIFVENENKEYWFRDGVTDTDLVEYSDYGPFQLVASQIYNDQAHLAGIPASYQRLGTEVFIKQATLSGSVADYEYIKSGKNDPGHWGDPTAANADVVFCAASSLVVTDGILTAPEFPSADTDKDLVVVALYPWKSTREFYRFSRSGDNWVINEEFDGEVFPYEDTRNREVGYNGLVACVVTISETTANPAVYHHYRFNGTTWEEVTAAPSGPSGPMIVEVDENATPAQVKTAIGNAFSNAGISPIPAGQEANVVFKTQNDVPVKISKYIYLADWEIMSGTQEVRFTIPASGNVASDNADVSISESNNHTIVTIPHNFSTQYIDVSIYDNSGETDVDGDGRADEGPKVYAATECVKTQGGYAVKITFDQSQASLGGSKFIAVFQK